jgi:acetyltransferase EpsM
VIRRVLLLGAGSFAEETADVISETPGFELAGFVKNLEPPAEGETLLGLPIFWIDDAAALAGECLALGALSTTKRGPFLEQVAAAGFEFATVVHPSARISATSRLGEGTLASVRVLVASHVEIGRHVILNRAALIGHHTRIADCVTVGPGANIAGKVEIGERAYIGIGAVVRDHVSIGARAVVGAGSVVTKDVPEGAMVFGAPARIVKRGLEGY